MADLVVALDLKNDFGSSSVASLKGKANLDIEYGSLRVETLESKENVLTLGFSSAEIDAIVQGDVKLQYGSLNVDRAGVINLESSFSAVDMDEVGMLNVSSSYDGYEIDEVGILDMTSFFGAFEIDRVGKTVEAMLTYGSLEIDHIAADFKKVEIEAEFSSVEIEFDDKASYTLNATASAGDIEGPKGINSEVVHSSNHLNQTLNGTVGANPGERTVTIKVSQGGIEID